MTYPNQTENNFVYKVISGISNYEIKKKGNKEKTTFNFFCQVQVYMTLSLCSLLKLYVNYYLYRLMFTISSLHYLLTLVCWGG